MAYMQRKTLNLQTGQYRTFHEINAAFENDWLFILFYNLTLGTDTQQTWEDNLPLTDDLVLVDKRFRKWRDAYRHGWEGVKSAVTSCGKKLAIVTNNSFTITYPNANNKTYNNNSDNNNNNNINSEEPATIYTNNNGSNNSPPNYANLLSSSSSSSSSSPTRGFSSLSSTTASTTTTSSVAASSSSAAASSSSTTTSSSSPLLVGPSTSSPVTNILSTGTTILMDYNPKKSPSPTPLQTSSSSPSSSTTTTTTKGGSWIGSLNAPKYEFHIEDDKAWTGKAKTEVIDIIEQINRQIKMLDIINISLNSKFKSIKDLVESFARSKDETRNLHFLLLWLALQNRLYITDYADDKHIVKIRTLILAFKQEHANGSQLLLEMLREKDKLEALCNAAEQPSPEWRSTTILNKDLKQANGWHKVPSNYSESPPVNSWTRPVSVIPMKGSTVLKDGWMRKQGDKVKSWKTRYFVLTSDKMLSYYNTSRKSAMPSMSSSPSTASPSSTSLFGKSGGIGLQSMYGKMKGCIDLTAAVEVGASKIEDAPKSTRYSTAPSRLSAVPGFRDGPGYVLDITTPKRVWRLSCETERDMEEWVNVLRSILVP